MSWVLLAAAFGMGFFGSPHCLGMCGGIVTAFGMSMQKVSASKKNALILTYHLGRLISYAMLGIIAGVIGTTVMQPFISSSLPRVLLGAVLVLIGLSMLGLPLLRQLEKLGMKFWQALSPIRQKVFPMDSFSKALLAGLLWGFLPCGLVYGALLMALAGHDIVTGALMMFVFGLGTIPMLIATQKTVGLLQQSIHKFRLRQVNGVLMILSGLAVIPVPLFMHGSHDGHSSHQMNHGEMNHNMSQIPHSHDNHPKASATASTPTAMPMNHDMSKM